jgi:hypothetical protein
MSTTEIATTSGQAIATQADMPDQVMALFQQALSQGESGAAALEKLVDLQERMHRRRAELEFSVALAEFQRVCPTVSKSSTAKIAAKSGSSYSFTYADLEEIVSTVRPHLATCGFSFSFDSKTDGKLLTCTCTLRHANGHREASSFTLPTENSSGASEQQKVGGALTYAKRQCLISVLGLAMSDPEDKPAAKPSTVTAEQAATLSALMDEVGVTPAAFCNRFGIMEAAELPAARYAEAVTALERRRKGAAS